MAVLKCRICGKKYDGCLSAPLSGQTYRWQDVACCPEHGEEYLRKIMISRGLLPPEEVEEEEQEDDLDLFDEDDEEDDYFNMPEDDEEEEE